MGIRGRRAGFALAITFVFSSVALQGCLEQDGGQRRRQALASSDSIEGGGSPGSPSTPTSPGTPPGTPPSAPTKPVSRPLPPPASAVFKCTPGQDPAPSPLRRLTRRQYVDTLQAIFGRYLVTAVKPKLDLIPQEIDFLNFDNLDLSISPELIEGFLEFGYAVGNSVANNSSFASQIRGDCMRQAVPTASCISNFISGFGREIFRRPLTAEEKADYLDFYTKVSTIPLERFKLLIARFLQAPQFLYQLEIEGAPVAGREGVYALTDHEIASRFSYMLTGKSPDDILAAAADAGQLRSPAGLQAQVDRLMADPAVAGNVMFFMNQWLDLQEPKPVGYSLAYLGSVQVKKYMPVFRDEAQDFLNYILFTKKGGFADLMTDRKTFPRDSRIADEYGVPLGPEGDVNENERSGIMTRVAFLTTGDDDTHPFRRAGVVQSRFMCTTPPRPDGEGLPEGALLEPPIDGSTSTRHRFEIKTNAPLCMSCHQTLNPLGFALEQYDALGRFRTTEKIFLEGVQIGTAAIDPFVDYMMAGKIETINGAVELSRKIAENPVAHQCAVQQWYRFSHGQGENAGDGCKLTRMYEKLSGEGGSFHEMIRDTALQPDFALKKVGPQ